MLDEQLSYAQARIALDRRLDEAGRALLRTAGEDGLIEIGRHGQALLTLVQLANPHPANAKLLGSVLRLGGDAAACHLIIGHGVPFQHWPIVVARSSEPSADILPALWEFGRLADRQGIDSRSLTTAR